MKKMSLSKTFFAICMIVSSLFATSSAFAMAGVPAQPPGAPPRGVAMQGDAAGIKLTGTITIDFAPLMSSSDAVCVVSGADLGVATAKLRLRKAGGTLENATLTDSGKTQIKSFTATLGAVPLDNPGAIQAKALAVFTPQILQAFFGVTSGMDIYTKDVSDFSIAFNPITYTDAARCSSVLTPDLDANGNEIWADKFTSFADVVLAVK